MHSIRKAGASSFSISVPRSDRMDFFYISRAEIRGDAAIIRGDEFKHLTRVVRKKVGEKIVLLDGEDGSYDAVIRSIAKDHADCDITERTYRRNEPAVEVTLAVSILRNPARFDVLVEKTTELGVRSIVPMLCERTIPKSEKHARLTKIALAAMKQCGRSYLPRILPLKSFDDIVNESSADTLRLIPHEQPSSAPSVLQIMAKHPASLPILVVVGPEGGFTDGEVNKAVAQGFHAVTLGPRRLRTETAAIAAVGLILSST